MNIDLNFAELKETQRRRDAAIRLTLWIYGSVLFLSYGGYEMYTSMTVASILQGLALLFGAVVMMFLAICAIIDLIHHEGPWPTKD